MTSTTKGIATPTFDPFQQTLTVQAGYEGEIPVTIVDIDEYRNYAVEICVNYGSQVGASFLLLVVLLLTTNKEKRRYPIFILNTFALAINTVRNILQILYFTGPFYDFYAFVADDYSRVPLSQYGISIAGDVLTLLLGIVIEVSLIIQVHTVCVNMRRGPKLVLMFIAIALAVAATISRLLLTIQNCEAIMNADYFFDGAHLGAIALDLATASICFFSAIFVIKVGLALRERHRLGLRQWGPLQILFTMGGQTMIIPAIFSILQFVAPVPELGSQILTLVAICLPLSSMWAAASLQSQAPIDPSNGSSMRQKLLKSWHRLSPKTSVRSGAVSEHELVVTPTKSPQKSPSWFASPSLQEHENERNGMDIRLGKDVYITTEQQFV